MDKLQWKTVTGPLRQILEELMNAPLLAPFRLVGGTALSLQIGHRLSVDIDLFTDALYGTINFEAIDRFLQQQYDYVSTPDLNNVGMGFSYMIGSSESNAVKVDLYYTDPFIRPAKTIEGVRLATPEEIIAMKLDVVQQLGRKKDFWDLHALLQHFSLADMLRLHEERYPYNHHRQLILQNLVDFSMADNDFDPVCLQQKYWEIVKLEIAETIEESGL